MKKLIKYYSLITRNEVWSFALLGALLIFLGLFGEDVLVNGMFGAHPQYVTIAGGVLVLVAIIIFGFLLNSEEQRIKDFIEEHAVAEEKQKYLGRVCCIG